jgi:uncharacterized BrkB/YihY/UPF0761 family membrane protein
MWVYYSSQILLFGAAIAWAIDGVRAEHAQPAPAKNAAAREHRRKVRLGLHPGR